MLLEKEKLFKKLEVDDIRKLVTDYYRTKANSLAVTYLNNIIQGNIFIYIFILYFHKIKNK